jgi:cytochrome c553
MVVGGRQLAAAGAAVLLTAGVVAGFAAFAVAQNADMGRNVWLALANCSDCHGWSGNGIPDEPRSSKGANLRETNLNQEQLAEVILCGRPVTAMPHYDPRAYTDDRCYGLTAVDLGGDKPPKADVALVRRHAVALAMFILEEFAGKGPATLEECMALMGENSIRCDLLRP